MSGKNRIIKRFDIWYVSLDPTIGSEIAKSRPFLVISPDEMNLHLKTVLVVPLTHTIKNFPTRIETKLDQQDGQLALDQIRAVDRLRFIRKHSVIDGLTAYAVCERLKEMFEY